MESVGKYQIIHPDGTKLAPVDMATLAEMVYAGIVRGDTALYALSTRRILTAGEVPYLAFLLGRLKDSPLAPPLYPVPSAPARRVSDSLASPPPTRRATDPPAPSAPPRPVLQPTVSPPPAPAEAATVAEPLVAELPSLPERSLPALSPQARTYAAFAAAGALLLSGLLWWSQQRNDRQRSALLGNWKMVDGTRLSLKTDGTGALTRPDPTYGNRTHLFRWERQGDVVAITERRILLPGGTRQTAADTTEPIALTPEGDALTWGKLQLKKAE